MRGVENRLLFVVGFWLVASLSPITVASQTPLLPDSARLELARSLVTLLRPSETAVAMLEQQAATLGVGDVPLAVEALAEAKADMDRLGELVAEIYARHMTADELRGLIEFHTSPLGQRLIELQPVLAREVMTASTQLIMDLMRRVFDRAGIQIPPAT
jgi:hypothetical protein